MTWRRALADLHRDRRGVAAIETGLVLAFLILPLLSLMVGGGQGMLLQYRMDRALHAGLMYAWGVSGAATTDVANAVQLGYGVGAPAMTPSASFACYCIDPTGTRSGQTVVACNSTCSSGYALAKYVTAGGTATVTPVFTMNWGASAWTISATATVRVPN